MISKYTQITVKQKINQNQLLEYQIWHVQHTRYCELEIKILKRKSCVPNSSRDIKRCKQIQTKITIISAYGYGSKTGLQF